MIRRNYNDELFIEVQLDKEQLQEDCKRAVDSEIKSYVASGTRSEREFIKQLIKEIIYSRKDEIIEKVIDKATAEIVRKGMPKLIERMTKNE